MQGFLYKLFGISLSDSDEVYNKWVDKLPDGGIDKMNHFVASIFPDRDRTYTKYVMKPLIHSIINAQQNNELDGELVLRIGASDGYDKPLQDSIDNGVYEAQNIPIIARCDLMTNFANKLFDVKDGGTRKINFSYTPESYHNRDYITTCTIIGESVESSD